MAAKLVALGGALILLSALSHAFLGWPPFARELQNAGVSPDVVAGLSVGWYFGSAAMVAMGLSVLFSASHVAESRPAFLVCLSIGAVYTLFGVAAAWARFPNFHLLLFVAFGLLVSLGALGSRR